MRWVVRGAWRFEGLCSCETFRRLRPQLVLARRRLGPLDSIEEHSSAALVELESVRCISALVGARSVDEGGERSLRSVSRRSTTSPSPARLSRPAPETHMEAKCDHLRM